MASRIIFVTGTDTGAGKTVLTALLLAHARTGTERVLAIKPFCSGGREDAVLLDSIQDGALPMELLNPFYFEEPVAPLVSMRMHGSYVSLRQALAAIRKAARLCDTLIVEGSGGLLVPLGPGFNLLDIIVALRGEVVVACPNRLGVINHTLLTVHALRAAGIPKFRAVLMASRKGDLSSATNAEMLTEHLAPNKLFEIPFLGGNCAKATPLLRGARELHEVLGAILEPRSQARPSAPRGKATGSAAKASSPAHRPSRNGRRAGGKG